MDESKKDKKVTASCSATIGCNIDVKHGDRWAMENDATDKLNELLQKLGIDGCVLELNIDAAYDEDDVEIEMLDVMGDETKDVDPRYTQM